MCVYDTDSRGHCVKNGPHCAFAHGVHDLRRPVYDIRELQAMETQDAEGLNSNGPNNLDKERNMMNDDPKWQDANYVLVNYKTEPCKRPPRLCRQGYACPQYHNSRDRRRSPKKYKYRSTPCPNVKQGDEWGDPSNCDSGDSCQYCHTRTEQQFHPEIYRSTKCNDIQQTNYCPRGAFCAFAHADQEMTTQRDLSQMEMNTNFADIFSSALPATEAQKEGRNNDQSPQELLTNPGSSPPTGNMLKLVSSPSTVSETNIAPLNKAPGSQLVKTTSSAITIPTQPPGIAVTSSMGGEILSFSPVPTQIGKPSIINNDSNILQRVPGAGFLNAESNIRKLQPENEHGLDNLDKTRRNNLFLQDHAGFPATSTSSLMNAVSVTGVSPLARPFYSSSDAVESVLNLTGTLDGLNLGEETITLNSLEKELDNGSGFSLTSGLANAGMLRSSAPVNIPGSSIIERPLGNLTPVAGSPLGTIGGVPTGSNFLVRQDNAIEQALLNQSGLVSNKMSSFSAPGGSLFDFTPQNMSPSNRVNPLSTGLANFNNTNIANSISERLPNDSLTRNALSQYEDNIRSVWNKQPDEAQRKAKLEQEKEELFQSPHNWDLIKMPIPQLTSIKNSLQERLADVQKVLSQKQSKCVFCEDLSQPVVMLACKCGVVCSVCISAKSECPYCRTLIVPQPQQRPSLLPQI